ncbi:SMP-30/gluconolactonase/LRE family protein [Desertihabitans brevis]|uniref:SMP-30/gluconolactonase/LRE family protein n=1 Tax=Desertihabitans brevis TaxID=2268447 RepID=A0A367YV82_9ACTN|nr:SMP-30/gluconolactonase/LRE family protein [Desertihabitans brevis]RCK68871.1 SMP-30/gluconolactonase/LRE family protein [Desertihabitans brevis]
MTRAEQLSAPCTVHGEGPVWDARGDRLLVVDMLAGVVVDLARPDQPERSSVGTVAAALRPRRDGGFVVALEHGFALVDDAFVQQGEETAALDDPAVRMNDGGCDPQGRFYCGTMAYDSSPGAGTLYRFDPDRRVEPVLTGVTISNGLQWSADGQRAFYNDTPTGQVDVLDFDAATGTFGERRRFAAVTGDGAPDGMAIDAEDGLWVALWGGSRVARFDADGALSEVVELPVSQVTACAFGGPDLSRLFITTSREGLPEGEEPGAGAVFTLEPGVRGAELHPFAG